MNIINEIKIILNSIKNDIRESAIAEKQSDCHQAISLIG